MLGCRRVWEHIQELLGFAALPLDLSLNEPERPFESFSLESESALSAMKKRRNGHVHHHTLKTIRAVVLGKDGVGKSGRFNISFV